MHIVYITVEYVTEKLSGGLGTYVDNMARIMSEHGHRVTVITLSHEYNAFNYAEHIHVIRVKQNLQQNIVMRTFCNSWSLKRELDRLNDVDKVDIVQIASLHAIGIVRSRKVPYIMRISSDNAVLRHAEQYVFDMDAAIQEKTLFDRLELYAVRNADYVFAPSKCCAQIVARRSGCKVAVIESPYLDRSKDFDNFVFQNKLSGKKYLLFNSTLSTLKGTHVGFEVLDELMSLYPDLHMVYAGIDGLIACPNGTCVSAQGILNRFCKKYVGRIIYLGVLRREQLLPIIANAYACVLLSRTENLSNSCIEAMSLKKIVIATYGASFEQLIKNKKNGLLIKRDSPQALLNAVAYLMNMSQEEREQMGNCARESVERLGPEHVYDNMMNVYTETIQNFRKRKCEKLIFHTANLCLRPNLQTLARMEDYYE